MLLMEAEQLELAMDFNGAVEKYRQAYKLCPELQKPSEEDGAPQEYGGDDEDDTNPYRVSGYRRMPPADSGFRTFPAAQLDDQAGVAEMVEFFDREGYLTVDGVLNEAEVGQALEYFKAFMSGIDIDVESKESLDKCRLGYYNGIVGDYGAGHSAMNWYCRSRPYVAKLFRTAYKVPADQKMITSYDGFNLMRNPETDMDWAMSSASWFHFDAGNAHNGRYIQGVVNLLDATSPFDAGLVLLPRSHKTLFPHIVPAENDVPFAAFLTEMNRRHWKTFNELKIKEKPFRVPMKPGSITIWKSTVLHCNAPCIPRRAPEAKANPRQLIRRLAVYVCMCADPGTAKLTEQRLRYLSEGRTTCHQPDVLRQSSSRGPTKEQLTAKAVLVSPEQLLEGARELL